MGKSKPSQGKPKKLSLTGGSNPKGKNKGKRKRPSNQNESAPDPKKRKMVEKPIQVGEEDHAFFSENGQFLEFLDSMNPETLTIKPNKKWKKKEAENEDDLESRFEQQEGRSNAFLDDDSKPSKKLPIKDDDKLVNPDIDSEEEREEEARREQRAIEKTERLRQFAREKREKRKALLRARKGLPPKEPSGKSDSSDDESDSDSFDEEEFNENVDFLSKTKPAKKQDLTEIDPDMLELNLFVQRQQEIASQKEKIATLASAVLEDPEKNIKKLRELHELCEADDITVRKLTLLSELQIFNDIIPSYRIIVGADQGVQLSKEVKKLRDFEAAILDAYQAFLQTLEQLVYQTKEILKAKSEKEASEKQQTTKPKPTKWKKSSVDISGMTNAGIEALLGLGRLAATVMGELLVKHHHFNFRANLITAVVPLLNTNDVQLSKAVSHSIINLFRSDTKGQSTLETVRTISQLIKKKNFRVKPAVLDVLLALRLRKALEEGESIFHPSAKKPKKHLSIKEKKKLKKEKEVEKELQQTEAVENKQDIESSETETLKVVFLIYFKILKNTKKSPILPNVLEGLARFSHLINLDLLLNLVEILKELIEDNSLPLESSMYTVITAFQAIKLQGDTLTVDLKDFYTYFYRLLEPAMASPSKYSVLIPLLVRSLELMITQRRILALDRVAAYAKRLLTLSLHLPPQSVLAILLIINQILRKYPKTQQLLDTEFNGMGVYLPEVDDPEHCNAFAATAWEFSLLHEHVHPSVTNLARMVMNQDPITEQNILKIFHQFDFEKHGIVPSMQKPREHVFKKSMAKAKKAGRDNVYYVQPSKLYEESDFVKYAQSKKDQSTIEMMDIKKVHKALNRHWDDVNSLMDMGMDMDDEIISSDDE